MVRSVLNLCANNYLGLADHPDVVAAAHGRSTATATAWRRCASSAARRPCTRSWRRDCRRFLGTDDTILYSSCFDANGGLFETILDENDAVISDALNHASIIDGIRLCRATRLRYDNNDMHELEQRLQEAADSRYRLIATDGVFSMDGVLANLPAICDLAERYDALVMVDDSHAVGLVGDARPRHARVHRRDGPRRHHHRHAGQGARWRVGRLHLGSPRDRSTGCGNARGRTCSPTASPPVVAGTSVARPRSPGGGRRAAQPRATQRRPFPRGDGRRPGSPRRARAIRSSRS